MTPRKQKLSHNRAFQQERLVQSENCKTNDFRRQNLFSFLHWLFKESEVILVILNLTAFFYFFTTSIAYYSLTKMINTVFSESFFPFPVLIFHF